jgi:hypothetical protein
MVEMRNTETITATTADAPHKIIINGKKNVLIKADKRSSSYIYIALSYDVSGKPTTKWDKLPLYGVRFFSAPKDKLIQYILAYVPQGTQYLTYYASNGSIMVEDMNAQEIQRQLWMMDGSYTERWEQGFRKFLYHGRTGAYFKSEGLLNVPFEEWTLPLIADADNTLQVAPFNDALRVRNSIDGSAIDHIYVGLPKAMQRGMFKFDANLPVAASGNADGLHIGFEVNSGGDFALMCALMCSGNQYMLKVVTPNKAVISKNISLQQAGVYNAYALLYDPPIFALFERCAGYGAGTHLNCISFLDIGDIVGKAIPFFCLENDSQVNEFKMGQFYAYELPLNMPSLKEHTIYLHTVDDGTYIATPALTSDGVQDSDEKTTATANVDITVFQTRIQPTLHKIQKIHGLYFELEAWLKAVSSATADLIYKWQAKHWWDGATWVDLHSAVTKTDINTTYVQEVRKGYIRPQTNLEILPMDIRLILQCNEANQGRGKVRNTSFVKVKVIEE